MLAFSHKEKCSIYSVLGYPDYLFINHTNAGAHAHSTTKSDDNRHVFTLDKASYTHDQLDPFRKPVKVLPKL